LVEPRRLLSALSGLAATALSLAGCGGPKALALPSEPVDRAAACAVVAAAEARLGERDVHKSLPLPARGRIVHYALLAGSASGRFDAEAANAVNARMKALQDKVTSGKWQTLSQPCRDAFPAATNTAPELPKGQLDAELACEELAEFVATALDGQGSSSDLTRYRTLRRALNNRLAPALRARVGGGFAAQQAEGRKALAKAAQLGTPTAVLDTCAKRFG
jgi:hypothetical protein